MKRSFSLRVLCVLVAIAAFCFATYRYFDPAAQYRRTKSQSSLVKLFDKRIHDGMTQAEISAILGAGHEDVPIRFIQTREQAAARFPASFPHGAQKDDVYQWWPCVKPDGKPSQYILQYRQGRLVNFDAQFKSTGDVLDSLLP